MGIVVMVKGKDKTLDDILKNTVTVVEESKTQIFDIYESARNEAQNLQIDIETVKAKVSESIVKVDKMAVEDVAARNKLAAVSKNFNNYTEDDIKATYEYAKKIQIKLAVLREQELNLRLRRDNLEQRLKRLNSTVAKARKLVVQVGVALGYLSAKMGNVVTQVESLNDDKLLSAKIINVQEDERLRVSREIHDGPAQVIANMIYQASVCERLVDLDVDRAKHGLSGLRIQMRNCLTDIRKIIFDLRPMTIDDLGLVAAVEHFLVRFYNRLGVKVDLIVNGKGNKVEKHIEISIFRIIQEALNNVHKHSGVKQAKLTLNIEAEYISVVVEDNGRGFDVSLDKNETDKTECYGLIGMRERVKLLGGQILLESTPGKGAKVRIVIPLDKEQEE